MILINFDGYNVGLKDSFAETYLEFNDLQDAIDILDHWNLWMES